MNETQAVSIVLASGILSEHAANDTCLGKLIALLSEPEEIWRTCDEIKISTKGVPANQIERTFRIRLSGLPDPVSLKGDAKTAVVEKIIATESLIAYCVEHPDAEIAGITFNCPDQAYGVFLGVTDQRVDAICVMHGPSIPPDAWVTPSR